jgi:methyl-accepting chemotaxis protein
MSARANRLNNMRVSAKIVLAVAVVAVVAMGTAGVAWARLGSLDVRVQGLKTANLSRLDSLVSLQNGMSDMYRALFLYQGAQSAAEKTQYE